MPCGGIWPADVGEDERCWHCNRRGADHWLEEWDSFLHKACIRAFLVTDEGQVVVRHKHLIQIGDEVLQEEDSLNKTLLAHQ